MYSYGSSARVGSGKRGHGNRPYRAPPDRSKQETQPPPLKQCDCLVEFDLPEYVAPSGEPRHHGTFGGRHGMQRVVRHVRSQFQCHLQIPGKNQGNPVALVASSLEQALPACFYVMQHIQLDLDDNDDRTIDHSITARIHRNVKAHVPVLTGRLYQVKGREESHMGCLFRQDNIEDAAAWSVAYYSMTQPARAHCGALSIKQQLPLLQTCVDNLTFRDATCQYQIIAAVDATVFAMGLTANVDKLLAELQQHAGALAAAATADTPKDET